MRVFIPKHMDYLDVNGMIIKLKKLKSINIDFERNTIDYEIWVDTNELSKLPGPMPTTVLYTGNHTIEQDCELHLPSVQHVIKCRLHDSIYYARLHCYCVSFSIKFETTEIETDFSKNAFNPHKTTSLDLS